MKFIDFSSLLETTPAQLAVLSTFQFDPDFFERRLLRCSALLKARRILIFMDASQWFKLLRQDVPARFMNRRYLVVPVRPKRGVFHPKLSLLVRDDGGNVLCGSNNLTRSGCTSNLELINSFQITPESSDEISLAQQAYQFFKLACDDAEQESGRIAHQWLKEIGTAFPWLVPDSSEEINSPVQLIHSYEGSLWDRVVKALNGATPKRFFIISPFFDQDGELAHRILKLWPKCKLEIVVQQLTSNLPIAAIRSIEKSITLSELRNSSRRLHAKLLMWETPNGVGCVAGSANFTTAAFDARNVETCLLMTEARQFVDDLFDGQFTKRTIKLNEFEPGTENAPESDDSDESSLQITCALLAESGELQVSYRHKLKESPTSLRLAIRTPGEPRPRASLEIPNRSKGSTTLKISNATLKDANGTILASLVAEVGDRREESPPFWIIQEGKLTHEPSGEGSSSSKSKVEETGEGLTEFLEELGRRDGVAGVVEYLRHLNIRFNDGGSGLRAGRSFRIRIRDPFRSDEAPEWLLNTKEDKGDLAEAIYDFADRHEKKRLRKHAKRGNINGMENFLDIFTSLVRLLYVYHLRGVVNRDKLIGRFCKYIQIATCGIETSQDYCEGYLYSVYDNLGDPDYLQEVCNELNFLGQIRAALLIVQRVRYNPDESATRGKPPSRPSECLPDHSKKLHQSIGELELDEPPSSDIMKELSDYNVFTDTELAEIKNELFGPGH
jgi:HKD family nuclease